MFIKLSFHYSNIVVCLIQEKHRNHFRIILNLFSECLNFLKLNSNGSLKDFIKLNFLNFEWKDEWIGFYLISY